jgi:thiamine-monophosphate kinase
MVRLIRRATARLGDRGVLTGIGDDTAVLAVTPGAKLLATTDLLIEDIHFRRAYASPRDIGWKALAVNLSDIASMGGTPRFALVGLAIPAPPRLDEVEAFYGGMSDAAAPHGVSIVGGDLSTSPAGWMINVTVLGEHAGTPRLRSAARPREAVAVTGVLGRSAAGLARLEREARAAGSTGGVRREIAEEIAAAHLRPQARVAEGRWLGAAPAVHAMMDLSDGLATDLDHICRESRVGARILTHRLPVAPATRDAAGVLGGDALRWATSGGEDYELLLTCDPDAVDRLAAGLRAATGTALTVIGEICELEPGQGPGVAFLGADGEPVRLPAGYEHFGG